MAGGERERFCAECQRTVHNLSALTRNQARKLVSSAEGGICGRLATDQAGRPVFQRTMNLRPLQRLVHISALSAAAVTAAAAESGTGSCRVQANVSDGSGAVLKGAAVSIVDPKTSAKMAQGVTAADGSMSAEIAPGTYSLRVESPGFMIFNRALVATCEQPLKRVDVVMEVGLVGEVVVVESGHRLPWRYRLLHPGTWF